MATNAAKPLTPQTPCAVRKAPNINFIGTRENIMANNRVIHFEIPANQPEALTKFYGELFGWKFQKAPIPGLEYWLCDTGSNGTGINGAVMQRQNEQQPWMNYVDVASIDAAIEKATKLGAQVALPKMPVPGVGAVAAIIDPQGNICGLWEQATK
jgi:predicted enzyme related to lactoylglutathione lyase